MTEISEDVLKEAFDLVEAMTSNKHDALASSDQRYESMLTDDANAIARTIMAREAKSRNEALEEAAAKVKELGAVIDHPSIYMGGPSRDAKAQSGGYRRRHPRHEDRP